MLIILCIKYYKTISEIYYVHQYIKEIEVKQCNANRFIRHLVVPQL